MLALALKAGFPPLAADRASRLAAQAVRTAAQPLELGAWAGAGEVTLRVTGDGDGWQARTAETLAAHAPTLADGNVSVVFRSPPRDALEQV
jgi:hypothetical protein